jgi:hypothetical protein
MSGEIIIFQHEMVQLFIDIIDLDSLPYPYLRSIIVEYIRCLLEYQLPSQPKLQSTLWKFMWTNKDFVGLQNLLQFKVLDDSLELALHLCQLGCERDLNSLFRLSYDTRDSNNSITTQSVFYPPAFDFGINMLYRLRQFKDVFHILVTVGKYAKALDFARVVPVLGVEKYSELKEIVDGDFKMGDRPKKLLVQRINMMKQHEERVAYKENLQNS